MQVLARSVVVFGLLGLSCQGVRSATWHRDGWTQLSIRGVTSVAFSPDGHWLAAGGVEDWASPGDLRIWDARTGRLRKVVRHNLGIESLAFSPDGRTLAVVSNDDPGPIRLWDTRTWRVRRVLARPVRIQLIQSVAFSPDSRFLVAGGSMAETGDVDSAYIWDVRRGRVKLKLQRSAAVGTMAFSPTGQSIVGILSGGYDDVPSRLGHWDARTGRLLWSRVQPGATDFAFARNGQLITSHSSEQEDSEDASRGALRWWNLATHGLASTERTAAGITALAAAPNGALAGGGARRVWMRQGGADFSMPFLRDSHDPLRAATFSRDGRLLVVAARDAVFLYRLGGAPRAYSQ